MNILSLVLIYVGLVIMIIGSVGIARLPDIYSRLQASSAADTVGVIVTLFGLLLRGGFETSDAFLGLLIVFFFITGPIITHAIAKAAFLSRVEPSSSPPKDSEK